MVVEVVVGWRWWWDGGGRWCKVGRHTRPVRASAANMSTPVEYVLVSVVVC